VKQLQAYNKAFGQFFARLATDKITTANTLSPTRTTISRAVRHPLRTAMASPPPAPTPR